VGEAVALSRRRSRDRRFARFAVAFAEGLHVSEVAGSSPAIAQAM
jgi:hypothetical protein